MNNSQQQREVTDAEKKAIEAAFSPAKAKQILEEILPTKRKSFRVIDGKGKLVEDFEKKMKQDLKKFAETPFMKVEELLKELGYDELEKVIEAAEKEQAPKLAEELKRREKALEDEKKAVENMRKKFEKLSSSKS